MRTNRNNWYFADKKTPICEQVWAIGQGYYTRMQEPKSRPRHRITQTTQLIKYFYWSYLTAAEPGEPSKQPVSIEIVHEANRDTINIKKLNQRHKGKEAEIYMAMPILDRHELDMWNFITNYGELTEAEHIFGFKNWKSIKQNNITALFNKNFLTTLEDPKDKKAYKNQGVLPRVLRYMRLKNLLLEHQAPERIIETYFGCNIDKMRKRHPELNKALDLKEQRQMMERANLMPNLKLGLGLNPY